MCVVGPPLADFHNQSARDLVGSHVKLYQECAFPELLKALGLLRITLSKWCASLGWAL